MNSSGYRSRLVCLVALLPLVAVAGCLTFPAPVPPAPLAKAEASALAKCQQTIKRSRLKFAKVQLAALDACTDGVFAVRLQFENGLIDQTTFDAGVTKMRGKCQKGYAKIGAASTTFVDAVVKSCTPAQAAVLGPYDALRFQSAYGALPTIETLAGELCTITTETVAFQLWQAVPRVNELLGYLDPSFLFISTDATQVALPNVPLDARCLPLFIVPNIVPTPTPQPTSTP